MNMSGRKAVLARRSGPKRFGPYLVLTAMLFGCSREAPRAVTRGAEGAKPMRVAAASAEETRPLKVGDRVPEVEVVDMEGRVIELSRMVAARQTIIIFYRGGWCPYCNAHLGALKTIEPKLLKLGYQVLALSADRPAKLHETHEEFAFGYRLLSDSKMQAASAFGIAFTVDDATLGKYKSYGLDLEEASGESHHVLPVPSVFIAGTDGIIRFVHTNPDYKQRLAPDDVIKAAEEAAR